MSVATIAEGRGAAGIERPDRVLDPIARTSEVLFGLIMALTFTGTLGAATAGREEVRTLLIGMVGCNLAWGLVDAVMYLMGTLTERGRALVTLRALRDAATPGQAHQIIGDALPPLVSATMSSSDLERVRQGLLRSPGPAPAATLTRQDWLGAVGVFLLVVLSTFPVVTPFIVFNRVQLALRVSNLIAIVMLFFLGYWLGGHAGYHPWRTGLGMVLLGVVLVGIAIALGG
jgi:VIT1/CCC1 family predicted Fe2+/Mn2+ transporter